MSAKKLNAVKADIRELAEAVWALRDEVRTNEAFRAAELQSMDEPDEYLAEADVVLASMTLPPEFPGDDSMLGYYGSSDSQAGYRNAPEERPVEDLLGTTVDESARALAAIGQTQRLRIVLLLLKRPASASDLVRNLSLGTSGAAYHHLNVLKAAGLVQQDQWGDFSIVPGRIPGITLILKGLSGMLDVSGTNVIVVTSENVMVEAGA
jgi:hypothetical protein